MPQDFFNNLEAQLVWPCPEDTHPYVPRQSRSLHNALISYSSTQALAQTLSLMVLFYSSNCTFCIFFLPLLILFHCRPEKQPLIITITQIKHSDTLKFPLPKKLLFNWPLAFSQDKYKKNLGSMPKQQRNDFQLNYYESHCFLWKPHQSCFHSQLCSQSCLSGSYGDTLLSSKFSIRPLFQF